MKKIEAIVRPEKLEELKDVLHQINTDGITINQVMGCGKQKGWKEYYRSAEISLNVLPKVKFEMIVADEKVEEIVSIILNVACTKEIGDGKIFISNIEDAIRIRTGERGDSAI